MGLLKQAFSRIHRAYRIKKDPIEYARSIGVRVGVDCRFISLQPGTFGSEPYLVSIGDHVTITGDVRFVTHDGGVWIFRENDPDIDVFAPIVIGDNVFIGFGAIVLPGVTIGDNCVIGAGSVVTRSIPANSVAAGVPARVLSSTDDYRTKVYRHAMHIRGLKPAEKRQVLLDRFETTLRDRS